WICSSQFFFCSCFLLGTLSQLLQVHRTDRFLCRSTGRNMSQWILQVLNCNNSDACS
ncbi:hypothetical protein QQF64_036048, partial [Cirrhinus molitorella]